LHEAARSGKEGVVRLLLDRGVNVSEKDNIGRTALSMARESEHTRIITLLEEAVIRQAVGRILPPKQRGKEGAGCRRRGVLKGSGSLSR